MRKMTHKLAHVIVLLASMCMASIALGNPEGGVVTNGNATISNAGNTTTINQSSQQAIVEWNSFNISANEKTQFVQPNASAVALNRINPQNGASQIFGQLSSNGRIILVNGAGIFFGPGARVDVGGLIASTSGISNANFLAGKYIFDQVSGFNGSITNEGKIIAANNGLVALLGDSVTNSGLIRARMGSIVMGSGSIFTLDFNGDQLINFSVDSAASNASTGVHNTASGKLLADGGQILVTAKAAANILNDVIDMEGVAETRSVTRQGGEIILSGDDNTDVIVSGKLVAAGKTGGTINVTGRNVLLTSTASLDASGTNGGGEINVGGNEHGAGPLLDANTTTVDSGAQLNASALFTGNGGKVVVWSNETTNFAGTITATGGSESGNGGFSEVSGHELLNFVGGKVVLSALNGTSGTLLLDPYDVNIVSNQSTTGMFDNNNPDTYSDTNSTSILNVNDLESILNSGSDVIVQTGSSGDGISGTGNITLSAPIAWGTNNTLYLNAVNDINVNATVTATNSGNFNLTAGHDISISSSTINVANQTYNNAVTLFNSATTFTGNVTFGSTLDGGADVTFNGGVTFNGNVGTNSALSSLSFSGTPSFNATDVITNNNQIYAHGLNTSNSSIEFTSNNGSLTFAGSINSSGATDFSVNAANVYYSAQGNYGQNGVSTFNTNSGNFYFNNPNGNAFQQLGTFTINGNLILQSNLNESIGSYVNYNGTVIVSNGNYSIGFNTEGHGNGTATFEVDGVNSSLTETNDNLFLNNIVKTGTGSLTINNLDNVGGDITVNGGIYNLASSNTNQTSGLTFNVNAGGTLYLQQSISSSTINLNGTGANAAGALEINNGTINIQGQSTLNIQSDATINIANGSQLILGDAQSDGDATTINNAASSGIPLLTVTGTGTLSLGGDINGSGSILSQAPITLLQDSNIAISLFATTATGTIDKDQNSQNSSNLTLGASSFSLAGDIGDSSQIDSLTLNNSGTGTISAANINTAGDQDYTNSIVTFNNTTSTNLTSGNNINFSAVTFNAPTTTIMADNQVGYYGQVSGVTALNSTANGGVGNDIAGSFGTSSAPLSSITFNSQNGDLLDLFNTSNLNFYATNNITFTNVLNAESNGNGNITATMSAANIQFNHMIQVDTNSVNGHFTANLYYTGTNSYSNGDGAQNIILNLNGSSNAVFSANSNSSYGVYYNLNSGSFALGNSEALNGGVLQINSPAQFIMPSSFDTSNQETDIVLNGDGTHSQLVFQNSMELGSNVNLIINNSGGISVQAGATVTYDGLFNASDDINSQLSGFSLGDGSPLLKADSGTLVLTNSQNFVGATINGGTISLTNSGALNGDVNVSSGATLNIDNTNISSVNIILNGGTLSGTGSSAEYSGGQVALNATSTILIPTSSDNLIIDNGIVANGGTNAGLIVSAPNSGYALPYIDLLDGGNGALTVTTNGNMTQNDVLVVSGMSSFNAGTGAITLNNTNSSNINSNYTGNQLTGAINVSNAGANDILIANNAATTTLGTITAGQNIEFDTQTGAGNAITVGSAIALASTNTLTLNAADGNINLNADITGAGNLVLSAQNTAQSIVNNSAVIQVNNFTLNNGNYYQNSNGAALAAFSATSFNIASGTNYNNQFNASFTRVLDGDGSSGNPYQIGDVYGLQGVATLSMSNNYLLANDIDASASATAFGATGFTPIGNVNSMYTGTFDGNAHVIANLYENTAGDAGLFDWSSGVIQNVGMTAVNISGIQTVGGLVANNYGGSLINDSVGSGTVTSTNDVGGLVGINSGSITTSHNSATVTGADNVGGLIGSNSGDVNLSYNTGDVFGNAAQTVGGFVGYVTGGNLDQNYNTGNVSNVGSPGFGAVGGFVGYMFFNGFITNSYSLGNVSSDSSGDFIGGFAGRIYSAFINTSYSAGQVNATNGTSGGGYVGGFLGDVVQIAYLNNDYYDSTVAPGLTGTGSGVSSNNSGDDATGLTTAQMKDYNNLSGFDFTSSTPIWAFTSDTSVNNGYPVLTALTPGPYAPTIPTRTISGQVVGGAGDTITFYLDGTFLASVTADSNGNYSFSSTTATANQDLFGYITTSGYLASAITLTPNATGSITGLNFTQNMVNVGDANTNIFSNADLIAAATGLSNSITLFSISNNNIVMNAGIGFGTSAVSTFNVSGDITAHGNIALSGTTALGASSTIATDNGSIVASGAILANAGTTSAFTASAGGITLSNSGNTLAGTVDVSATNDITVVNNGSLNVGTVNGGGNISFTTNAGDIAITSGIAIASGAALSLTSAGNIAITAPISGTSGTLNLSAQDTTASITDTAAINVGNFALQTGEFYQNANGGTLPDFNVANNFTIEIFTNFLGGGSAAFNRQFDANFTRVVNGDGSANNPYQLTDVYGLQGISSLSVTNDYILNNNIDATAAASWNNQSFNPSYGTGFSSLFYRDAFQGTFDGANYQIQNLTSTAQSTSLFNFVGPGGLIKNLGITNANLSGGSSIAGLANMVFAGATIDNVYVSNSMIHSSQGFAAGLVITNLGTISNSHASNNTIIVDSGYYEAGFAINNSSDQSSSAYGIINSSYTANNTFSDNVLGVAGFVVQNSGIINNSYNSSDVYAPNGLVVAGLVAANLSMVGASNQPGQINNSYNTGSVTGKIYIGGLVGENAGFISQSYNTGAVTGEAYSGGLVGYLIGGSITQSFNSGNVTQTSYADFGTSTPNAVGGLVGEIVGNSAYPFISITDSYNTGNILVNDPTNVNTTNVGGLIGSSSMGSATTAPTISTSYSAGTITVSAGETGAIGGITGSDDGNGVYTNTYFDHTIAPYAGIGTGGSANAMANTTGLTSIQMQDSSQLAGFDFSSNNPIWAYAANPAVNGGYAVLTALTAGPYAPNVPVRTISGQVVGGNNDSISFYLDGTLLGSVTTDASGNYNFYTKYAANNGDLLAYITTSNFLASAVTLAPSAYGNITGFNFNQNTLNVGDLNTNTLSNTNLISAAGSLSNSLTLFNFSGGNIVLNSGINFATTATSTYTLNGNVSGSGNIAFNGAITVAAATATVSTTAGSISANAIDGATSGANSLIISSTAGTSLNSSIGSNTSLSNVTFNGPVSIGGNFVVVNAANSITFTSTIDGANGYLTLESNANLLEGNVGDTHPLSTLTLTAPGGNGSGSAPGNDAITAASITTKNNQSYENNTIFQNGAATTLTTLSGGNINFGYADGSTNLPSQTTETFNSPTTTLNASGGVYYYGQALSQLGTALTSSGTNGGNNIFGSFGTSSNPFSSIVFNNATTVIPTPFNVYASGDVTFNGTLAITSGINFSGLNNLGNNGEGSINAANVYFNQGAFADNNGQGAGYFNVALNLTDNNSSLSDGGGNAQAVTFILNSGTFTLNNSSGNGYAYTVNAGKLVLANSEALDQATTTINSPGQLEILNSVTNVSDNTYGGGTSIILNGNGNPAAVSNQLVIDGSTEFNQYIDLTINNNAAIAVRSAGDVATVDSIVTSGDGSQLVINGAGTIAFSNVGNSNSLGVAVNSGTLSVTGANAVTNDSVVNSGGTFNINNTSLNGFTLTLNGGTLSATQAASLTSMDVATTAGTSSTINIPTANDSLTFDSASGITGLGSLTVSVPNGGIALPYINIGGDLTVTTNGDITQTDSIAAFNATFNAGAGAITLTDTAQSTYNSSQTGNLFIGAVNVSNISASDIAITDLITLNIGTLNAGGNVTFTTTTGGITTRSDINLTFANTLTLNSPSTIAITNYIGGAGNTAAGSLVLNAQNVAQSITDTAAINLVNFTLSQGEWYQNGNLPAFNASNFNIINTSNSIFNNTFNDTFTRVAGGTGSAATPYQIADVYGLQGAATLNLSNDYTLTNNIDASGTANWTSLYDTGGFVGIGQLSASNEGAFSYAGTFNGAGFTISNLSSNYDGLFIQTHSTAVIENIGLINPDINGFSITGGLVAWNNGTISNSYVSGGSVTGGSIETAGLAAVNWYDGIISSSHNAGTTVTGNMYIGGFVGANLGSISNSYNTGNVLAGTSPGQGFGGFAGANIGTITGSYSTGNVTAIALGVGGFTGVMQGGSIESSYTTGNVIGGTAVGGFVGAFQSGTIDQSFAANAVSSTAVTGDTGATGGFVGELEGGTITNSYSVGTVSATNTGDDVGGFAGNISNSSSISTSYSANTITATGIPAAQVGAFVGNDDGTGVYASDYYDSTLAPIAGIGSGATSANVIGLSTADMKNFQDLTGFDFTSGSPIWAFTSNTATNGGYAVLTVLTPGPYKSTTINRTIAGQVVGGSDDTITFSVNGVVLGTVVTDSSGNYTFTTSTATTNGDLLAYISSGGFLGSALTLVPGSNGNISGLNFALNTLTLGDANTNSFSVNDFTSALGSLSSTASLFSLSGNNITLANGISLYSTAGSTLSLSGALAAAGAGANIQLAGSTVLGATSSITSANGSVSMSSVSGAAALTVSSATGSTISGVVNVNSIAVDNGGTISGKITGSTSVSATGGTLNITNSANNYTGGTAVSSGSIATNTANGFGSGIVSVANGGAVDLSGQVTVANAFSLSGTGSIYDLDNSGTDTVSGAVTLASGSSAKLDAAAGSTLAFTNTTTGSAAALTLQDAGTISLLNAVNVNSLSSTASNVNLGGNVTTAGSQSYSGMTALSSSITLQDTSVNGGITLAAVKGNGHGLTINTNGNSAITGIYADNGTASSLAFSGNGMLTLSNINSYSGGTTISAGEVLSTNNAGLGTGTVAVGAGALLAVSGNLTNIANAITLSGTAALDGIDTSGTDKFTGAITLANNSSVLIGANTGSTVIFTNTINGAGDVLLEGPGAISLQGAVGNSTAVKSITTTGLGSLAIGANVTTTGVQTYGSPVNVTGTDTLATTNSAITFSGALNGGAALTLSSGTAQTILSGAVGGTTALTSLSSLGAGGLSIGANVTTAGSQSYSGTTVLGSSLTLTDTASGAITLAGVTGNGHGLTLNTAGSASIGAFGNGSGASSLTQAGIGTLALSSASTYTGGTTISHGVVSVSNNSSLGTGGVVVASGAALDVNGGITVSNALDLSSGTGSINDTGASGTDTLSGAITLGSANTISSASGATLKLSGGSVSGASALTLAGAGAITLQDTLSSLSSLAATVNTLNVGANITTTGGQSYSGTTVLGNSVTLADSASGAIVLGAVTGNGHGLTLNTAGSASIGVFSNGSGASSLTQAGTGTVTLNSASTYTGGTTISHGVVSVSTNSGLGTGSVVVASGAALDVNGGITVSNAIDLSGGTGSINDISASGTDTLAGTINLGSANTFSSASGATLKLSGGSVSGASALTLAGAGIINLQETLSGLSSLTATVNTLDIGANISSSGAQTYNHAVVLNGTDTLSTTNSAITFNGTLNGAAALTLASGTAQNSLNGIVGGNIALTSLSSTGAGGVSFGANVTTAGSQSYAGTAALSSSVTLQDTSANGSVTLAAVNGNGHGLTINTNGNSAITGIYADNGAASSLIFSGNGMLTLSHANTYSGGTTIAAGEILSTNNAGLGTGTVSIGAGSSLAVSGNLTNIANAITMSATSSLYGLDTSGTDKFSGAITLASNSAPLIGANTGSTVIFTNTIDGAGNLLLEGPGSISLQGAVGGNTALNSITTTGLGSLAIGANVKTSGVQTYGAPVTVSGTNTLTTTNSAITFSGSLNGASALTLSSGTAQDVLSGIVGGSTALTSLTSLGAGGILLGANITTAGGQSYNGTTVLGASLTLADSTSGAIVLGAVTGNGHGLTLNTAGSSSTGSFSDGSGASSLTQAGSGILLLNSASTYSGGTSVNAGEIEVTNGNALGSGGVMVGTNGILTIATTANTSIANTITLNGNSGFASLVDASTSGNTNSIGNVILKGNSLIGVTNSSNSLTISGTLSDFNSGTYGITKVGAGNLILSSANTAYLGTTTEVQAGTLTLNNANAVSASTLKVDSGATLSFGMSTAINGLTGSGNLNIANGTTLTLTNATANTFGGALTGTGVLDLTGNGSLTFTSALNFGGAVEINAGTLNLGGFADTIGPLSGSGTLTGLTGGLTIATGAGTNTFSGALTGGGSLTIGASAVDTGTLILSGNSSFTGTMNVVYGNLEATRSSALGSTVNLAGGSLEINNTNITAAINLNGGALIGMGTSGTSGAVNVNTNSQVATASAADTFTMSGTVSGTGALDLEGAGTVNVTSNITSLGSLTSNAGTTKVANVTTSGNQIYNGAVVISNDASFVTSNGNVAFNAGISGASHNVNIASASTIQLAGTLAVNNITVTGSGSNNTLNVQSTNSQIFNITSSNVGNVSGAGQTGALTFSNIQNLGGSNNGDTFKLAGGSISSITGGSGNNTIVAGNGANTFNISGMNSGNMTNVAGFAGIQNLVGGTSTNQFVFGNGAVLSGSLTGTSAHGNSIDYSAYTSPMSLALTADNAGFALNQYGVYITGSFSNIQSINGNGVSALNIVNNKANVITFTNVMSAAVNDPTQVNGFDGYYNAGSGTVEVDFNANQHAVFTSPTSVQVNGGPTLYFGPGITFGGTFTPYVAPPTPVTPPPSATSSAASSSAAMANVANIVTSPTENNSTSNNSPVTAAQQASLAGTSVVIDIIQNNLNDLMNAQVNDDLTTMGAQPIFPNCAS